MKKMKTKFLSILLAFAMSVTLVPDAAQAKSTEISKNVADGAEYVEGGTEAAEKFAEAACKFCEDFSKSGNLATMFTVAGGLTAAASGCISILKIIGVIEDPTEKKLNTILDEIHDIQEKLVDIYNKLDNIQQTLINMQISDKETDRATAARDYLQAWTQFKTDYLEKFSDYSSDYQAKITTAISQWWANGTPDGAMVLYTKNGDNLVGIVCNSDNLTAIPDSSDNGSTVEKDASFILPADSMPKPSGKFDVNTFQDKYKDTAKAAILTALNGKKAVASDAFYTAWNALSDADKNTKATQYAEDLVAEVVYDVSCDAMSADHTWVSNLITNYNKFASNLTSDTNGLSRIMLAIQNLNAFEGEVKEDIMNAIDSMIFEAGLYGQLALNAAGQDRLVSLKDRQALQKTWVTTIKALDDSKAQYLTGHDNYCYVSGGVVKFNQGTVKPGENRFWYSELKDQDIYDHQCYIDEYYTDWKPYDSNGNEIDFSKTNLVGDVSAAVIYHDFLAKQQTGKTDAKTFMEFANKYGVGFPTDNEVVKKLTSCITTSYLGQSNFPLSDQLKMRAYKIIGSWFDAEEDYTVYGGGGNPSKSNFKLHDCVKNNYFDFSSGASKSDAVLCARAYYEEDHWKWYKDEMIFFTYGCNVDYKRFPIGKTSKGYDKSKEIFYIDAPLFYLTSSAPSSNGVGVGSTKTKVDPSKHMVKIGINGTAKLKSATLEYNGKAQKPVVRTIDGIGVHEGKDYTIKVNKTAKKIGTYKATITGKGHFTGKQTVTFKIVKANNGLTSKGESVVVKASALKKKAKTVKKKNILTIKKAKGKVTYKITKTNKAKKYFSINKKTGDVKIKKGLKAGDYILYVTIKAAGNKNTKAKTVTDECLITVQ